MLSLALTGTSDAGEVSPFTFIVRLLKSWTQAVSKPAPTMPVEFEALFRLAPRVLQAKDCADMSVRLETMVPHVVEAVHRLHLSLEDFPPPEAIEEPTEQDNISVTLGFGTSKQIHAAMRDVILSYPRIFDVVRDMVDIRTPPERRELLERFLIALAPTALQDGATVPHAFVWSTLEQLKGTAALVAIGAAVIGQIRPERWLGKALADATSNMAGEFAWQLSTAGYPVEGVRLPREPADLAALFRETDEADAAFMASLGETVSGRESQLPLHER